MTAITSSSAMCTPQCHGTWVGLLWQLCRPYGDLSLVVGAFSFFERSLLSLLLQLSWVRSPPLSVTCRCVAKSNKIYVYVCSHTRCGLVAINHDLAAAMVGRTPRASTLPIAVRKTHAALLPLFVALVVVCYLDRASVSFAALQVCSAPRHLICNHQ